MVGTWHNQLYYGDNLEVMRKYIPDESVDLIYLDPPFNSKATYNVLFAERNGTKSAAQITAFEDTWHWGLESEEVYHEIVTQGPKKLADLIQALRSFLGQNDMMAYLVMMAIRLVEIHRVLKPTGSVYLHCDTTASHYLKIVSDAIFGGSNFRNEIIWTYQKWGRVLAKTYGYEYQNILFYGKSDKARLINYPTRPWKSKEEYIGVRKQKVRVDPINKKEYVLSDGGGGKRVKRYLEDAMEYGRPIGELWDDIAALTSSAKERLGYPTQKAEALLERIIEAGSNEGDLVLDPFCGCGTTVTVAERLNRRWIGIDITYLAVNLMKRRLHDTFERELSPYHVYGVPKDLESARALALQNRYQFEWWAVDLVNAHPAQDKRKGADSGVDGYINFFDDNSGKAKRVVVQVKSGRVSVRDIRDLVGVMEREKAVLAAFITLEDPTRPMIEEAATAGFYESEFFPSRRYPRLQILTIAELLNGKELQCPEIALATFKKAQRRRKGIKPKQKRIF